MSKELTKEQKERLPEDGDYRDWILYMASENDWSFSWYDYNNEIAQKRGELRRLGLSIEELVEAGLAKRRRDGRTYDITRLGIDFYKNGNKEKPVELSHKSFETETFINIFQRISESINESKSTKTIVIIASIATAFAASLQAYFTYRQTHLLEEQYQERIAQDSLSLSLEKTKTLYRLSQESRDSLTTEFQKQSKRLDSTYQELIKVQREKNKKR